LASTKAGAKSRRKKAIKGEGNSRRHKEGRAKAGGTECTPEILVEET